MDVLALYQRIVDELVLLPEGTNGIERGRQVVERLAGYGAKEATSLLVMLQGEGYVTLRIARGNRQKWAVPSVEERTAMPTMVWKT